MEVARKRPRGRCAATRKDEKAAGGIPPRNAAEAAKHRKYTKK
ncbi:hypothetical protein QG37_00399 [Candidozyma auris]|uniref:Uncharacterized protein n=1 Tax=Candidozyma auris TaxID=498019 RepID=A0A0L0P9B6_CANAR|nr:hypothetical protein QG37_00399 [[Candida] auris]